MISIDLIQEREGTWRAQLRATQPGFEPGVLRPAREETIRIPGSFASEWRAADAAALWLHSSRNMPLGAKAAAP